MCGFAGLIDPACGTGADALAAEAHAMAEALRHRGPDDGGVWVDERAGVAMGHRRLSVVDLSPEGHQPMLSEDSRFVFVFNGEVYNFRELKQQLEHRGHRFRGHSDTEVLLAAMREWGVEQAVGRTVGMFAFALWDRAERVLWLGRDRMGEKPLYYGFCGRSFVFASELKALRAHARWEGEVDRDALALYMRFCYVPAPFSIYRGISKLAPGTLLRWAPGRSDPGTRTYWSLRDAARAGTDRPFRGNAVEAADALESLIRNAVSRQMVADVPVGAFLSGGVDSSTVVALMQSVSPRPVRTFTVGFHDPAYDEAPFARAVAAHLGTQHTELYVSAEEARAVIPRLPEIYDEPFADSSQLPTFLVARMARSAVTVSLSGDGGDELFGGYGRYVLGPRIWKRLRHIPRPLQRLTAAGLRAAPVGAWDWLDAGAAALAPGQPHHRSLGERVGRVAELLAAGRPEAVYTALITSWPHPAAVVEGSREPRTPATDSREWPGLGELTSGMMYADGVTYLPDDILVKVDRAAMAVSLETRVPLLDHRVVEFAWTLPQSMKVGVPGGKGVLRSVLNRHVPARLIERPKQGFGIPLETWLLGPLRPWVEELLDPARLRAEGYLAAGPIRTAWRRHQGGSRTTLYPLWCVLMFQSWLEHVRGDRAPRSAFESPPSPAAA